MGNLLSMLCPSRGRPRLIAQLAQSIAETATARCAELLVYVDADDTEVGEYRHRLAAFKFVHITVGEPLTVGKAWNVLAAKARGNLLMMGSDDLICQSVGWDRVLQKEAARFTDGIFVLWPDDGANAEALCGRPVVSRRWYKTLGHLAPEHFEFSGCAVWLADIARKLDRLHRAAGAVIEHRHPTGGKSARAAALHRIRREGEMGRDSALFVKLAAKRTAAADKLRKKIQTLPEPVQPPPVMVQPPTITHPSGNRQTTVPVPAHQPVAIARGPGIPKLLHFFWIGSELPDFAKFIMDMWHDLNPDYTIRLHGEEVLRPEYQPLYDRMTWPSLKVDVLKWCALQQYGGYTIDADTVPLRPMSTFTATLDRAAGFVAVNVPPADEKPGMERCDMGFIGASAESRIWAAIQWYLSGNVDMTQFAGRRTHGGCCCMEWLLVNVPHLMTRFPAKLYCPYACTDTAWFAKGKAFWQALRAGKSTAAMIAEYNRAWDNPLAWHLWQRAVK